MKTWMGNFKKELFGTQEFIWKQKVVFPYLTIL